MMRVQGAWFWVATAALLGGMGAVEAVTARGENQTWDEGMHLAAGYSYIRTGDFRLNTEHPPLFKLLAGLTLVPLHPFVPLQSTAWEEARQLEFSTLFMFNEFREAGDMLFRGRTPTMALSLLLGLAIALWTRRHFGVAAALGALFLYALDPNLIAHGRYITNDLWVAAFVFFAVTAWARFLRTRRRRDLVLAGAVLGLTMLTKFSALFVLPVLLLLYLFRWWQQGAAPIEGRRLSFGHLAASLAVVAAIAALVIAAAYGPATVRSFAGPPLQDSLDNSTVMNRALGTLGWFFDLPAHPFFNGLRLVGGMGKVPHPAYLLGRYSNYSWWYYYPVVFAVKTPTAVLLLVAGCAAIVWRALARRPRPALAALRQDSAFRWVVLAAPIAVYTPMLLSAPVALGIRYMLPLFPFLFILIAALVMPRARVGLIVAVAALQLFETASIYPDYLAFFNTLSGGPSNGPRYLADSNIDWGQDLKKLHAYLHSIGWDRPIPIAYFGSASLTYYGIDFQTMPQTQEVEKRRKIDSIVAISVTELAGVYGRAEDYRWLRELKPMAKVGYSICIYDLRQSGRP